MFGPVSPRNSVLRLSAALLPRNGHDDPSQRVENLPARADPMPAIALVMSKAIREVQNPLATFASIMTPQPSSQNSFGPLADQPHCQHLGVAH